MSDLGGSLDWATLFFFVQHLDHTSALYRASHPDKLEQCLWLSGEVNAYLFAELIDAVNVLTWNLQCANTPRGKSRPRKPKPYPRPGVKMDKGVRKFGRDPIPVSQFDEWWESAQPTAKSGGDKNV